MALNGGKFYLADKIISLMPPHLTYCEPYAGGLQVLLKKPYEGINEVVNDKHGWLMRFWEVMADDEKFEHFVRMVNGSPFSEDVFNNCLGVIESNDILQIHPVDAAYNFFIVARKSRQGLMKDFATISKNRVRRGMNEQVSAWLTAVEGLPEVHERMKRVVVLNREATDVIRQMDATTSLFYLDPPYMKETRSAKNTYEFEMTHEQHEQLLIQLSQIKGKFILSGYWSELYDSYAKRFNWSCENILLPNNSSSSSIKELKKEYLWMNYKPAA